MTTWEELWRDAVGVPRTPPADGLLESATEMAAAEGLEAPSGEAGRMLTLLAGESGVRRVLDVGTGVGYWATCLARGVGEPEVLSVDPDAERQRRARRLPLEAGVEERVALMEGEPLDVLRLLEARFDVVHVDVTAGHPMKLLDAALNRLEVGGVVICNGVAPRITDPPSPFCGYFLMYPQLDAVILPLGSGLAVGRKTRPLVTDQGGPY